MFRLYRVIFKPSWCRSIQRMYYALLCLIDLYPSYVGSSRFQSPFLCVVSVTMRKYRSNQTVSERAHTVLEWVKNMVLKISLTR
jgi:hypothetical protein